MVTRVMSDSAVSDGFATDDDRASLIASPPVVVPVVSVRSRKCAELLMPLKLNVMPPDAFGQYNSVESWPPPTIDTENTPAGRLNETPELNRYRLLAAGK